MKIGWETMWIGDTDLRKGYHETSTTIYRQGDFSKGGLYVMDVAGWTGNW